MSSAFKYLESTDNVSENIINNKHFEDMKLNIKNLLNKDLNDKLNKTEILKFLDNNSKNKQFDRNLSNKIFSSFLDNNEDENILVKDFIINYLSLIEEIEKSKIEYDKKKLLSEKNIINYESNQNFYKNENLTSENISPNTNLKISFYQVNFIKKNELNDDSYYLLIKLNNKEYKTENFNENNYILDEKTNTFEFKLIKKSYVLTIYLLNNKNEILNGLDVKLQEFFNTSNNIEEFKVDLEIPSNNDNETLIVINAKAFLIYDYYNYYQNLIDNENDNYNKINEKLNKINNYHKNLTDLNCFNETNIDNLNINNNENEFDFIFNNKFILNGINKFEGKIIILSFILSIIIMILGKCDFLNFILILGVILKNLNNEEKNVDLYLIISYIYDVLFFISESKNYFFYVYYGKIILLFVLIILLCKIYYHFNFIKNKKNNNDINNNNNNK
jgi:hypothetical protein